MTSSLTRVAIFGSLLIAVAAGCGGHRRAPADDLEQDDPFPMENILRVTSPGLSVTRTPEGRIAVQISRGPTSFYSSNEPLLLVDDEPYPAAPGGVLSGINPHDIVSIRLLTNPADTGIYGMRGANGVILIKTKKTGKRGG